MEISIRDEQATDIVGVSHLIKLAFKKEHPALLVCMLRCRKDFIPDLSLVAHYNGIMLGYILLSPVRLSKNNSIEKTLLLEPVCVHPQFQKMGIGSTMIYKGLEKAANLGFGSVFVIGQYDYYSKFGFRKATDYGIESSIDVTADAFLALKIKSNALTEKGKLLFPEEIFS